MSKEAIPLSSPDVAEADVRAVVDVLHTTRLSLGPRIPAFESAVAGLAGRRHGIAVNSGTSGLHLCVRALDIQEGDEVITTPFSFVATANCLLFERAKPVFVDIDLASYNMDPSAIEAAITPRTKAILPVEVFGNVAHFDQYERIARKHGLKMIEDCCEALGGYLGDRPAGSFGDCGVFGFYPNKQITTGEGGIVVTDDDHIADVCRSLRNQGRDGEKWLVHHRLGYNYRMSEITAALGEAQLRRLGDILQKRRQVAAIYNEVLADIDEIHLPPMADPKSASWFVYAVRLADRFRAADRDAVMAHLIKCGIGCNKYFMPIHLQPYFIEMMGASKLSFPRAEWAADRTIALPFFTNLARKQALEVRKALKEGIREVRPPSVAKP
ncbi:MAG: DegT/DnrJ/EryC1/StrS family aminotransferase [Phycisphaerae bacterium]